MIPLKDNIPTARFPILTVALIVINIAVFAWQLHFPSDSYSNAGFKQLSVPESDENTLEYGAIPYRLTHPGKDCAVGAVLDHGQPHADIVCQGTAAYGRAEGVASQGAPFERLDSPPWWVTVFTSMFMHGGIFHIAFNMLFLWIFGNNVEDSMGRPRFLLFYLLAGLVAAYTQALLDTSATTPLVGASGAIAGVLGGYLLLYPAARVLTLVIIVIFFTLVEVPAFLFLLLWFGLQFLSQFGTADISGGSGVAYYAHIGGFLFGLAAIKLFANRQQRAPPGLAY